MASRFRDEMIAQTACIARKGASHDFLSEILSFKLRGGPTGK